MKQQKLPKQKIVESKVDLLPPIMTQEEFQNQETEPYKCCACNSIYPSKNKFFSKVNSKLYSGNNYYIPLCNGCLDKLYTGYVNQYGNKEQAIERICMHFDVYYSTEIIENVSETSPKSFIKMYFDKALLTTKPWKNKTYSHTLAEKENEFNKFTEACGEQITSGNQDEAIDIEEAEKIKEAVKFWGFGFTKEEYDMLNNNYKDWIENYTCDQHAQVVIFKTMSLLQMKITTGSQRGDKIDPLCKQLTDYMNAADIQPKQKNANTLSDKQTLGTLIEKFEQTDPIPDPEPTWLEKVGLIKYITVWFLGHFAKMMGLKNSWNDVYEEEIAKYTAKSYVTEEEESDEPTFEDMFGSRKIEQ